MKKVIETDESEGLESLLGEKVLLLCANYFYAGKLVGVNDTYIKLEEPSIIYETGEWGSAVYKDVQRLPVAEWYIRTEMIESFGRGK